ncbi:AsmA-like C-terminal region-containing protein [Mariniflexile ostreae]|uniref:AsmA-like C-terminal region-containing protein n=1 Tax=Mariniflexile ostreae TaxID=1520892 RepID=A0ABV5F9S0_9FLAO
MKKFLKITGITLLIIIALLIAIPFVFQGQIKDMVKQVINQNLNAHVEFSDVSLSFIRSFPQAHVDVSDLVITNFEPFKDETFASIKNISFTMSVKELFKSASEGPIVIKSITVDEALLTLKTDKFGNSNYDITKEDEAAPTENESSGFAMDIQHYSIKNSALTYSDEASKMLINLTELNHIGKGIFSGDISELDTNTDVNVSFTMDSTNYLNSNPVKLDAIIGLDLNNDIYTFKENKALINALPIKFNGYVKLIEEGQEMDISFENPGSDFKDFLALIPETYSKNIENVETTGSFKIKGIVKGLVSEETIPKLDISITSNNASFKYPDLPKGIKDISINTLIKNETGYMDDTYVDIKTLDFKIDNDAFKSSATIKNMTKNMVVDANIDGILNLANLTKAYPIALDNELTGILKAKIHTAFDMNAIETNAYERIKADGNASITGFVFSSEDLANPIQISQAAMSFSPQTVSLNTFHAKTGESDLKASGSIHNLIGFLLSSKATLKGNFSMDSNLFKVSDFMAEDKVSTTTDNKGTTAPSESLKIPAFLDCTIKANAKTVVYDNLNLKNVSGILHIKDQQVTLENLTSQIFDGALAVSGDISTKNETPTFHMNLNADGFDIAKSFKDLELLQNLAPIAKLFHGKLNTTINLSGQLDKDSSPILSTVSGSALAQLLTTKIDAEQSPLLNKLQDALSFIEFDKLDLKDLKTKLEFANGKVSVQPFDLKYKDIGITVSGAHGFDKSINYSAIFNVPAKYLGSDINRLIGKINDNEVNNMSIPITANIGGSVTSPSVKTDFTSGVSNLTKQLVEIEKQKLLSQGTDKVKDLIGGILGGNKTKTDSIKEQQNNSVQNVLKDIMSNKSKSDTTSVKKDSIKTNTTKDAVKNVLGGLLGGKKKANDTVK